MNPITIEDIQEERRAPFKEGERIGSQQSVVYEAKANIPRVETLKKLIRRVRRSQNNDNDPSSSQLVMKMVGLPKERNDADIILAQKQMQDEIRILQAAQHHHVIKLFGTYRYKFREEQPLAIIMERADGDISSFLDSATPTDGRKQMIRKWLSCLSSVVNYIHRIGIRHRDIKPTNILVKGSNVLLADFGISRMGLGQTLSTTVPGWARPRTATHCAPEVEDGSSRGRAADIFSLGAVFLELLVIRARDGYNAYTDAYNRGRTSLMTILGDHINNRKRNSPRDNGENELAKIIQPPRQYVDSDIEKISHLLKQLYPSWQRPIARIYTVLYLIGLPSDGRTKLVETFIGRGTTDYKLPFRKDDLSHILEPGYHSRFFREQVRVLHETLNFEKHSNLEEHSWKKSLKIVKVLGGNRPNIVQRVEHYDTGIPFALKLISRGTEDNEMRAELELKTLKRVKHDNIVSIVTSFTSPLSWGILMTPVADFDLADYLSQAVEDTQKLQLLPTYFGCLMDALSYLHYEAYVGHNDIKPQNILVHQGRVLFTDFGISLDWSETLRTTVFGPTSMTPRYSAPEIADNGRPRKMSSDIWSLGCVFLEMTTVLKGEPVNSLTEYLRNHVTTDECYYRNTSAVVEWANILREKESDWIGNQPLVWIGNMLEMFPERRPTAGQLRRQLLSDDSVSSPRFFGSCCRGRAFEDVKTSKESSRIDSEVFEGLQIEEYTEIATAAWPGEQRVYVQATDGSILQVIHRQDDATWQHRKTKDVIGIAKPCSPIAAAAWQREGGYGQPAIRVYILDQSSYIRERVWDPMAGWSDGALSELRVKAAPFSQLAVTSWGEGNMFLCYQTEDRSIHVLHGRSGEQHRWQQGVTLPAAAQGSPLAIINFDRGLVRGIRLYHRVANPYYIQEVCWDGIRYGLELQDYGDADYYVGKYEAWAPAGTAVAAIAWIEQVLEMRIYLGTEGGVNEARYSGVWVHYQRTVAAAARGKRFAVGLWSSGRVSIYFMDGLRLQECEV
ncbi:kinase-like domain-containing protein [Xylaria curta]|nr:kinase-like domain-containing protein [Xylaria curta]